MRKKIEIELINHTSGTREIRGLNGENGKDGETPSDERLIALIEPRIPKLKQPKDGKTPTKTEIKEIIKEVLPEDKLIEKIVQKVPKIKGDKGEKGDVFRFADLTPYEKQVLTGPQGSNGVGVPRYGTAGQVLAKSSSRDFDTEWVTGGGGGAVDSVNGQTGVVVLDAGDISGFATVATTGSYNDLSDKPTIPTGTIDGTLTTNELVYSVDSNTVGSLAVATYPSLAEIANVKGVTSAIQTQLNGKEPTKGSDDNYVTDAQLIVIGNTSGTNTGDNATNSQYSGLAASKQDTLVSGTNIKTINSTSLLGSGDIVVGGGDVSKVGTPVNNQIGVWTGDGTIEGDTSLTFDTSTDTLSVGAGAGIVVTHSVKSDASDGLLIEANNGTDIAILGAGNTANGTWYGSHNIEGTQVAIGKNATTLGKLKLYGNTSGDVTIQPNAVAGTGVVLTAPATTGTIALTSDITGTNSGTNTGDQTITNSSDATSHTVTLSASGGSVQLIEGSNITLTTGGTGSAGTVTIAATAGGTGDVVGPASATDNAIARFDSTTGKLIQNSAATIADTTGDITAGKYNTVAISGASTPTLAVTGSSSISGANTGDQTSVSGNAGTATALQTARTIGTATGDVTSAGSSFDGSANNTNALTIANSAVTLAKMANLAQDQFIGRTTASTGVPETATITAAARTVLDDTTVGAMVDTLGGASSTGTGGLVRATSPTLVTPALGTPSALVATNATGTATGLTSGITNALKSATTTVDVSAATAPTSGQVLTATSGTAATWQTPAGGSATIVTCIPTSVAPLNLQSTDTYEFTTAQSMATNTIQFVGQIVIPFNITINKFTIGHTSTPTDGTFNISLYSADGQTRLFTKTTATLTGNGTAVTTTLDAPVAVTAGVYYLGVNSNGTASVSMLFWSTGTIDGDATGVKPFFVVSGEQTIMGRLTITASTPATSFNPITDITYEPKSTLYIRFDN